MEGQRHPAGAGSAAALFPDDFQIVYEEILGVRTGYFLRTQNVAVRPAKQVVVYRKANFYHLAASAFREIPPRLPVVGPAWADVSMTDSQLVTNVQYPVQFPMFLCGKPNPCLGG